MIKSSRRKVFKGILINPKDKTIKTFFKYDNDWADDEVERIIDNQGQPIEWDKFIAFQEIGETTEMKETLDKGVFFDVMSTSSGFFVGKVFIVGFNKMQEAAIPDESGCKVFLSEHDIFERIRWIEHISNDTFEIFSN
jgi:hypothetical protein